MGVFVKTWEVYVNVYTVEQCYGGPEEGGWYYRHGKPVACCPIGLERSVLMAVDGERRVNDGEYAPEYESGPDVHAMCDEDREKVTHLVEVMREAARTVYWDDAVVARVEWARGREWPAVIPHYE